MKIKDITQTVIFICCLIVVPVFTFAYFLYANTELKPSDVFDKSFSPAFGFFGGAATLAAAYIAAKLVSNWKDQTKFNEQIRCLACIQNNLHDIKNEVDRIRNDNSKYTFFAKLISQLANYENKYNEYLDFDKIKPISIPDKNLFKEKINNIKFYSDQIALISGKIDNHIFSDNSLGYLDSALKSLIVAHEYFKYQIPALSLGQPNSKELNKHKIEIIENIFFCSEFYFNAHRMEHHEISNRKLEILNDRLESTMQDIYKYREILG